MLAQLAYAVDGGKKLCTLGGTYWRGINEVIDGNGPLHGQKFRIDCDTNASSGVILTITETRAIHERHFVMMTRFVKIWVCRKVRIARVFCTSSFGARTTAG